MGRRAHVLTIGIPGRYPASKRLPDSRPDLWFESLDQFLLQLGRLPHFAGLISEAQD
jgi:hypothetical protein